MCGDGPQLGESETSGKAGIAVYCRGRHLACRGAGPLARYPFSGSGCHAATTPPRLRGAEAASAPINSSTRVAAMWVVRRFASAAQARAAAERLARFAAAFAPLNAALLVAARRVLPRCSDTPLTRFRRTDVHRDKCSRPAKCRARCLFSVDWGVSDEPRPTPLLWRTLCLGRVRSCRAGLLTEPSSLHRIEGHYIFDGERTYPKCCLGGVRPAAVTLKTE